MMPQVTLDFYELLKKGGSLLQFRLNNLIQNRLNNISIIGIANARSSALTKKINQVQKYSEQISSIINLPTKTDLSNTTQLILQSEEKIDHLDEQLYDLSITLNEVKAILESISSNDTVTATNLKEELLKQEGEITSLQQELVQAKQLITEQKKYFTDNGIPINNINKAL